MQFILNKLKEASQLGNKNLQKSSFLWIFADKLCLKPYEHNAIKISWRKVHYDSFFH